MVKQFLLFLIRAYQAIGPYLFIRTCRFYPSCSHYAIEAITKKGARQGLVLIFKRLLKCHPFSKSVYDPVR